MKEIKDFSQEDISMVITSDMEGTVTTEYDRRSTVEKVMRRRIVDNTVNTYTEIVSFSRTPKGEK